MAELAIPLRIDITADGTSAVAEIQNVGNAAHAAGQQAGTLASNSQSAASGIQNVGTAAQSATGNLQKATDQLTKIGSSMTKLVTAPIVAAYTASVKGAADLTETVSKTEQVFGNFYGNIEKWSETSIDTMGIAQSTALEMASLYGDMATGMGFSQSAAAEMSTQLTTLAADLASFKNISIDTAETALKSVFTGETESLKNLGVVMTEANLQAYALAQGIETKYSAMTQAEKVTLRYQYVMAQTSNAQGDFVRTGDSLSNKLRKLGQTIKQVGEQIGQLIVPYVTAIVDKVQAAVTWISNLDDGVKNMILTIGAVAAAIGPLLLVGTKVLKLVTAIKTALSLSTMLPVIAAITAAVAGAALLVSAFTKTQKEIDRTSDSYQTAKEVIEKGISTSVTVNTSELDNLDGTSASGTITLGASPETLAIISNVKEIASDLQNSESKMSGTVTLNGSTTEAQAALQAVQNEVDALLADDENTTSIADLQAAIDKCKALEIDPSLDEVEAEAVKTKITEMITEAEKLKTIPVTFSSDEATTAVVDDALELIDELTSDTELSKSFTIEGDSTAAQTALDDLETAVNNLITGEGTIAELEAAIAACEKLEIDPTVDASLYRLAKGKLDALKNICGELKTVDISLTATETAQSDAANIQAFIDKVNSMGWTSKSFHVTGDFKVSDTAFEVMEEYAKKMTEAATATSDYDEAVDNLNETLDEELERKIGEVNAQANEQIKAYALLYNEGAMDEATYVANVQAVIDGAKAQINELKAENELAKELNETLANGTAADDAQYTAQQMATIYAGQTFSTEDVQGATAYLAEQAEAGNDMTEAVNEANIALIGLKSTSETAFASMATATEEYNTALEGAAKKEAEAANLTAQADEADELANRFRQFSNWIGLSVGNNLSVSRGTAIDDFVDELNLAEEEAEELKATMTTLLSDENGNLTTRATTMVSDAQEQVNVMYAVGDDLRTQAKTAQTEAETARATAVTNYDTAMQSIADTASLTTEELNGELTLIKQAGVSIPEETVQQVSAVTAFLNQLNGELDGKNQETADKVANIVTTAADEKSKAEEGGKTVGEALVQGITAGAASEGSVLNVRLQKIIREGIEAAKQAADIHSPSRVMRDQVGKMLMQGISVGMEDETPSVLERIKSGMNRIISGAQSIVTGSSLSFPTTLALANGMSIDYNRMGEALSSAVQDTPVSLVVKDKAIAETTSDATWRAQAIKAQRINRGKGRW